MSEDLLKVTLNLYRSDVEDLEHIIGYGWSAQAREKIHEWVKSLTGRRKITVGELFDEQNIEPELRQDYRYD